jgi:DNA replication protein DnaC
VSAVAPPLDAALVAGLKRLQLAHFRAVAAETLQTATTQRWAPEALLRALITTEVTGRDAANQMARLKAAGFPVAAGAKGFDDFQVAASSVPPATVDYLASLEWLRARENLCLVGPPGTGKSHLLVAAGRAAVLAGYRVKYAVAADLVETLYRGLADNTVGKVIDGLLRHDAILVDEVGFAPLDDVGTQLLFRFVAAAYERRSLGVASHWPFDQWGRFLPQQSTAASLLDRLLHHAVIVVTAGDSFRMKEARSRAGLPPAAGATISAGGAGAAGATGWPGHRSAAGGPD